MARASTFTSYINVEPDRGIEQKFANLERQANQTFNRIAQAANRANAGLTAGVAARGPNTAVTAAAMRMQADALRSVARANQSVQAESGRTATRLGQVAAASKRSAREVSAFERTMRTTAQTLNVVQGPLGPLAGRVSAVANAVGQLSGLRLGLAGVGAGLFALVGQANKYTEVRSSLVPLYESQKDVNRAMQDTIRIAEGARVSLQPVVDLYARLTMGGRQVGMTSQQIAKLTETAAKAAKLSGGTTISQDAGLYQFAQGIGSGTLAGDELKSIRENTLRLAKAIADGMGVPIGALKELGRQGKLTPKVVADALEKESERIDRELERLPETLSSATAKFQNALMVMVGEGDQAFGFTTALAEALAFVAKNLELVTTGVLAMGTAFAGYRAGTFITNMHDASIAASALRAETKKAALEEKNNASIARVAAVDRIKSLRSIRVELNQQVQAERAVRREALATARAAQQNARRDGMGFVNPLASQEYSAAMAQARQATANLTTTQERLRIVQGHLQQSTVTLTAANARFRTAKLAVAGASRSMAAGLRAVWAAINPLSLAISFLIPALITLAFRKDAAGRAADEMAQREATLSKYIDLTTGKIIQQNKALLANERLKASKTAAEAQEAYEGQRSTLGLGTGRGYLGMFGATTPQAARDQQARYDRGEISVSQLATNLERLMKSEQNPSKIKVYERLIENAAKTAEAASTAVQTAAYDRLLQGKGRPGDVRLAQGAGYVDPTGADIAGGTAGTDKAKDSRKKLAKASDEAAKAERRLQDAINRTDKREDILGRYSESPNALVKASKDIRELNQLIGKQIQLRDEFGEAIAGEKGLSLYTAEMAAADAARINYGVRKPIRDAIAEQERQNELARLRLQGYDAEATALEKALSIQEAMGAVTAEEYETLLKNEQIQRRINDAMEARNRLTAPMLAMGQEMRDTFQDAFVSIAKGQNALKAIAGIGARVLDNAIQMQARKFAESLFSGTDEKLKELINGKDGVDRAIDFLESSADRAAREMQGLGDGLVALSSRVDAAMKGLPGGSPSTTAAGQAAQVAGAIAGTDPVSAAKSVIGSSIVTGVTSVVGMLGGAKPTKQGGGAQIGVAEVDPVYGEIVVTGGRLRSKEDTGELPDTGKVIGVGFEDLGGKLDKLLGTKFFKGVGATVGDAFAGAGTGMMASSFAKALGIKQSKTGAAIGGAIGNAILPGVGGFVGGLIGGTIGGAFKKAKWGTAIVGGEDPTVAGNKGSYREASSAAATGIHGGLQQIADQLGGTLGGYNVSIGQYKGNWRVSTTGYGGKLNYKGNTGTSGKGLNDFGDDEAAAIAFAISDALKDGAIKGISQASQNILKSGQDLQKAIEKAVLIESIPKRLMQMTDPVRYAVTQLNKEFETMIAALKEGGATAQQFADAQKLYDLERAKAIAEATSQAAGAIQSFLDEMVGGQSSPLNKRTVYQNSAAKLAGFRADIEAGKMVDENELLTAAKNFQDASRALFGSGAGYFSDFDSLHALLTRAKDNITAGTSTGDLPGSPFASDGAVQNALNSINGSTQQQTNILAGKLDQIIDALYANDNQTPVGSPAGSTIRLLPGF